MLFRSIGIMDNDKNTLKHEICHALYYLNGDFRSEMTKILTDLQTEQKQEYDFLQKTLFEELEYDYNVLSDESIAWLATSTKKEIVCDLKCDWISVEPYVKRFKKVLRKYNKHIFSLD